MGQAAKMTRGGKRPGAGRPSLQVKRVDITLTENQIAWLKKRDNASETIRKMLEEKMNTELAWETLNDVCGNTDFDAWRGMTAEHCQTCETRAEMWNPIHIRGGDLLAAGEVPPEPRSPSPEDLLARPVRDVEDTPHRGGGAGRYIGNAECEQIGKRIWYGKYPKTGDAKWADTDQVGINFTRDRTAIGGNWSKITDTLEMKIEKVDVDLGRVYVRKTEAKE